ncbi:MAG: sensor histidine kinase [Gemmatimonadota bacterium]
MLAGRAVRPAREIAEQAEAITAGSLAARIQAHADTTEYERLVAVLNGMLERLDSAFAAQQRFVADAGHEIRHPVAVLRAALELALRRERSPEEYRRAIEDAAGQADRIGVLAEGLLTLARADAGVLRPERTRQDLGELARSAARRFDTVAANRGITLTVRAAPVLASVDVELVDRVLDNLLDNALKFTPAGGVVEVVVERDGGHAFVHVADTGPGVPVEYRSRLFERFFRADASRSPEGGAGLGLAIAKGIAEAHGGDVLYQPREPTGSCFTLRLPLSWIPV